MAGRNKRLAIMEAARRVMKIHMRYKKVSGELKVYKVEPYSYRYKRLKSGWRKVLFAFHRDPAKPKGTIKMFVLTGIKNVKVSHDKFKPRWPVEI